jgi:hypothetical protein
VAGHQPPQPLAPRAPPSRSLRPSAPREPPGGLLRPSPTPTTLLSSAIGPRHSKPQERPPVGVKRPKCPANKNNDKIYQMKK